MPDIEILTLDVRRVDRPLLMELLATVPGVKPIVEKGWFSRRVHLVGAAQDIEQLRPKLQAWERDCLSREAW